MELSKTFHLAQEFYWYNPAKLPSPSQWVSVKRIRVKDAVDPIWWFSKTPYPKASNRRVLTPYRPGMLQLLRNGYKPGLRPSGYNITDKFNHKHSGAIPPNILILPNTNSNDRYLKRCKGIGISPHPARFPCGIPDFFIRFLTNSTDIVMDPFGGSNTTGYVAERLGRKWLTFEIDTEYLEGSKLRFDSVSQP
jgi:site-specific DNA-methyltransferase (cytosine-N4-specific)